MFPNPSKMYQRTLGVVIVAVLALSSQARAQLMEVTFQAPGLFIVPGSGNPGGPIPENMTGYFFFNTSTVTGGLRFPFASPGLLPGQPGTVNVSFGAGPSGAITVTYSDGSVLTRPFTSGFGLSGDQGGPVCGFFDDCFYRLGNVLTLSQFNAAPDPWAIVLNGMVGSSTQLFPVPQVDALFPGSGTWGVETGAFLQVHSVPEPTTFSLLALGLACLGWARLRPGALQRTPSAPSS